MAKAPHRLGDLQLAILAELWKRGEATVSEVHEALEPERGLALTTIGTMLRKMERRGLVRHRAAGRVFVYRPAVAEADVSASMVSDVVDRLFEGDVAAMVSLLLSERDFDPEELSRLRRLIDARARELSRRRRR